VYKMAEITAALVKDLRERTGAGMMDCKKALTENGGNIEEAIDWLRKKGLSAAAKKAGRVTAEGLVGVHVHGTKGAVVEVNAETDFVGRNELFQNYVQKTTQLAVGVDNAQDLLDLPYGEESRSVSAQLAHLISVIGENMNFRRMATLSVNKGVVVSYIHSAAAPGLGRIGVLVALESAGDAGKLKELGHQIAMHIAAANPQALNISQVDPATLQREKDIFIDQAKASGRPDNIIEKMVEGRVRKFYEESVLLEQAFVMDGKTRIADVIASLAKDLGTSVELTGFVRYALGDGIEKQESDFAAEVSSLAS
jgi:elongation factor Ts